VCLTASDRALRRAWPCLFLYKYVERRSAESTPRNVYFLAANIASTRFCISSGETSSIMRGHPPETPKRIFELARAVTVKLIHDGLALRGAGVRSGAIDGVKVISFW
jgi:hypothetical protein